MPIPVIVIHRSALRRLSSSVMPVFVAVLTFVLILLMLSQPLGVFLATLVDLSSQDSLAIEDVVFRGIFEWISIAVFSVFYAGFIQIGIKHVKSEIVTPIEVLLHSQHWFVVTNLLMMFVLAIMASFFWLDWIRVCIVMLFLIPIMTVSLPVAIQCDTNSLHALLAGFKIGLKHLIPILFSTALVTLIGGVGFLLIILGLFWPLPMIVWLLAGILVIWGIIWGVPYKIIVLGELYVCLEQSQAFESFAQADRKPWLECILSVVLALALGVLSQMAPYSPGGLVSGLQLQSVDQRSVQEVIPNIPLTEPSK